MFIDSFRSLNCGCGNDEFIRDDHRTMVVNLNPNDMVRIPNFTFNENLHHYENTENAKK